MRIGIRHEDKSHWERRTALPPKQAELMLRLPNMDLCVESSPTRIYPDSDYESLGARIVTTLEDCKVIFGVKEIPPHKLQEGAAHVFFSHTIKAQPYNMGLLQTALDRKVSLIDYECIADEQDRRLVFFGPYAGFAGMINALKALGERMAFEGDANLLEGVKSSYEYADLNDARTQLKALGEKLGTTGIAQKGQPLVIAITGYGNVGGGAREIAELFPHETHDPLALLEADFRADLDPSKVHIVVFKEEHMFCRKDQAPFELQDYFSHPEAYEACFEPFLPSIDLLVNCIFWNEACPRLITKEWVQRAWAVHEQGALKVIGDVSIDIEGSIEISLKATTSDAPAYVINPRDFSLTLGIEGEGPVVVAVDNLPCELPRDASRTFGQSLEPFLEEIALADYSQSFEDLALSYPIKRAMITHRGELCERYSYLKKHL
jgi:saccharopine dehydrogenase (NAD+, L-lysine forming)